MILFDDHIWDFDLSQALAQVSAQRRTHALRYRLERDQRLSVAAYRLLQRALLEQYGIDKAPQFIFNAAGKPLLDNHPDIHFSLSHCNDAVACAVSDRPVGIDVETIDHYSQELAEEVMNESEMQQILTSSQPAIAFARLWTMKESLYKLTGDDHDGDIRHMLHQASNFHFTTINQPRLTVTLCSTEVPNLNEFIKL